MVVPCTLAHLRTRDHTPVGFPFRVGGAGHDWRVHVRRSLAVSVSPLVQRQRQFPRLFC